MPLYSAFSFFFFYLFLCCPIAPPIFQVLSCTGWAGCHTEAAGEDAYAILYVAVKGTKREAGIANVTGTGLRFTSMGTVLGNTVIKNNPCW